MDSVGADRMLRPGHSSAYPEARRLEIGRAMKSWWDGLPAPKVKTYKNVLPFGDKIVHDWMAGRLSLNPDGMYLMYRETGNKVFLMSAGERATWLARKEMTPADLPFLSGENQADVEAYGISIAPDRRHVIYTNERLVEIVTALEKWLDTVPSPKVMTASKACGASYRTIGKWLNAHVHGRAPNAQMMAVFFRLTGDKRFELSAREAKGFSVLDPEEEMPTSEPKTAPQARPAPARAAVQAPASVQNSSTVPAETTEKAASFMLASLNTAFMAVETLVKSLPAISPVNKKKAVDLVVRIIRGFKLTEQDFLPVHEPETDPATLKRLGRVLKGMGIDF